jgi:hypothetical protein
MRRKFFLIFAVLVMIVACNSKEKEKEITPTQVAREFFVALQNGDVETAESYVTPQFLRKLDLPNNHEAFEYILMSMKYTGDIENVIEREDSGRWYVTVSFTGMYVEEFDDTLLPGEITFEIMRVDEKFKITDMMD